MNCYSWFPRCLKQELGSGNSRVATPEATHNAWSEYRRGVMPSHGRSLLVDFQQERLSIARSYTRYLEVSRFLGGIVHKMCVGRFELQPV